ncbi:MAG: hypothetical protein HYR84_13560 [Planctomycetes bacterium]|nr:hypothetical protein [Planctomycetota bacterium]
MMTEKSQAVAALGLLGAILLLFTPPATGQEKRPQGRLRVDPPHISTDKSVKYDYDIVYVRAPRLDKDKGRDGKERAAHVWPNAGEPTSMRSPTDLMLLHPDGSEHILVAGGKGAIADPYVSFDAQWVYYSYFHDVTGHGGADVYKAHVKSRKVVRLTQQQWTPNTGVADAKKLPARGVYNMHPCPLPGGRIAFTSDRDRIKAHR